jgi:lipid-binding SYLF domain-containing protein
MTLTRIRSLLVGLAAALAATVFAGGASAQSEQQKLVQSADATFSNFERDPEMSWFQRNIGRAKAVLIAPNVVKAGFIVGGSGGQAVLVARDSKSGRWAGPVFYEMATASIGFQAGVAASETIVLVMSEKGMQSLLGSQFKFGGDASVAAGPVGKGAQSDVVSDFVAFSRSKGLYGGLNLDGTSVRVSDDWNANYYGKKVTAGDIVAKRTAPAKGSQKLVGDVAKAAAKKS